MAEALRDAHSSSLEQQQQAAVKKLPISGEKQRVRELKEELDSHQERHENVVEVEKKKPAQKNIHQRMVAIILFYLPLFGKKLKNEQKLENIGLVYLQTVVFVNGSFSYTP